MPMRGRWWAKKRCVAPGLSHGSQRWRSPSRSCAAPASRPVAVPFVSSRRSAGSRSRKASISDAAARVSPSDTAWTQTQPLEGGSR
jgi:hypothetical protein